MARLLAQEVRLDGVLDRAVAAAAQTTSATFQYNTSL
jgi:hypothetical protein